MLASGPANGALTLNPDGSFVYTPNSQFNGADSFTYTASDGQTGSVPATVTINVSSVNDTPVANNDSFTGPEDTALTGNVLANDTDADNDPLTAVQTSAALHGTGTINANGSLAYTPAAGFSGLDVLTYHANDGNNDSADAAVVISVEDLESLEETLDVMGDEALLADIREALAELAAADAPVLVRY